MLEKYFNNKYLDGDMIVGDDFTEEEIELWYKEEEEAYCELSEEKNEKYLYENINNFYGLDKIIKKLKENNSIDILCFGGAWGGEIQSILKILNKYNIENYEITIVDSSTKMLEIVKEKFDAKIVKANINGSIHIESNIFDIITCFGVLHHIPNVNYVFSELVRVLKREGIIFLREPISSMGNWNSQRVGTTINERGLGNEYINKLCVNNNIQILKKNYLLFSPFLLLVKKIKVDIDNKVIIFLDFLLSKMFSWNIKYHRKLLFDKFAPGSIFLILQK